MDRLPDGDAIQVDLRGSMVGDSRIEGTSHESPAAKYLPFTVVYCSGQDEDFPASELNKGVSGRGWQSSRFCYYPQELVLELQWPSRIINMQMLCHEYKIPTKVEVFVNLMTPYVHSEQAVDHMKRLGYLSLDPNERSGHQARELKSIYVDSPAAIVRLVLHNCYTNKLNCYNQVGLMALIITGDPLDEQQWALINQPGFAALLQTPRKQVRSPKAVDSRIQVPSPRPLESKLSAVDTSTANRIIQLQHEKNSAVRDEDYDEAKRLKVMIERLKVLGEQIRQLEIKKCVAVESEDYDAAKLCKMEIEKLRRVDLCSPGKEQAKENGTTVTSECGLSSEESVYQALLAEEAPQGEFVHEETFESDHCDNDKREFGTQTHQDSNTLVKMDKEIACATPDVKSPFKPHPFIPAMTAPNLLPPAPTSEPLPPGTPTFSYQTGPTALLPIMTRTFTTQQNGMHPFYSQNGPTMLSMTANPNMSPGKLPSLASAISSQHTSASSQGLPNFFNQAGSPASQLASTFLTPNGSTFLHPNGQPTSLPPMLTTFSNQSGNVHSTMGPTFSGVPNMLPAMHQTFSTQNGLLSAHSSASNFHGPLAIVPMYSNQVSPPAVLSSTGPTNADQIEPPFTPQALEATFNNQGVQPSSPPTKRQLFSNQNNGQEMDYTSNSNYPNQKGPPAMHSLQRAASEDLLTPEPLTEALMAESGPLLAVLDLYQVECFHSKQWQLRDKSLHYIMQETRNQRLASDPLAVFRVLNKVIIRSLNDRVSNVFNSAMQLLRLFVTTYAPEVPNRDLQNCVSDLVNILLEKLGDSNVRTREAASEALMFLASKKEIGLHVVAVPLLRPPKNQGIWRLILGRLQLLLLAIPTFGLQPPNKMGFPTEPLMSFVGQAFNSANGDVRNAAVKVTTEVYRLMGAPVEKYLKNVKPVVREVLTGNFERVAHETQSGFIPAMDASCSDCPMPPLRCPAKMMQFNFDDKPIGPHKRSKNIVGRVTSEPHRLEEHHPGEPSSSNGPNALRGSTSVMRSNFDDTPVGSFKTAKNGGLHPLASEQPDPQVANAHEKGGTARSSSKSNRGSSSSTQSGQEVTAGLGQSSQQSPQDGCEDLAPSVPQVVATLQSQNVAQVSYGNASVKGTLSSARASPNNRQSDGEAPVDLRPQENPSPRIKDDSPDSCLFCGQKDPQFLNNNNLDLHFCQQCPMLVSCTSCRQIVEISLYKDHLLLECSSSKRHVECQRCYLAIPKLRLSAHQKSKDCRKSKQHNLARCPICYHLVEPSDAGWREHVLKPPGCLKNPRTLPLAS